MIARSFARHRLLFLAVLTGLTAGLAAVSLKILVHLVSGISTSRLPGSVFSFLPAAGLLLTIVFTRFVLRAQPGTTADILVTIVQRSSIVERFKMNSHLVGSALTVGLLGSAGLESPIAITGAAIGSNLGRNVNYKERTLLLSCGAAAGIAAVFNAPVAGMLFAIEVLLLDVSLSSIIPLVAAAVTGSLCSIVLQQNEILFEFPRIQHFDYRNIPFYFILALFCSMISLLYSGIMRLAQRFLSPFPWLLKWGVAGLILWAVGSIAPVVLGEGYRAIAGLTQGLPREFFHSIPLPVPFAVALCIFVVLKIIATAATLKSGGIGGNFAPSLFVGACAGFALANAFNAAHPGLLPEGNFTIVGMAGTLSGVMYAPLTAVFLIAEATGGYTLMVPLLLVSALTHVIVIQLRSHSMELSELEEQGVNPTRRRDAQILGQIRLGDLLEKDFVTVFEDAKLRDLIGAIAISRRNLFPVVTSSGDLVGIVTLNDIRDQIFKSELYDSQFVRDLMVPIRQSIDINDSMQMAMDKFDHSGAWNLPVVEGKRYAGFVSRSRLFAAYREGARSV